MKKGIFSLITMLMLGLSIDAQSVSTFEGQTKSIDELKVQAKKAKNKHFVHYDKFDEFSIVSSNPYNLIGLKEKLSNEFYVDHEIRALWFTSGFAFAGATLTKSNTKFYLFFAVLSDRPGFWRDTRVTIIADDLKIRLTQATIATDLERLEGDSVAFEIDRKDMEQIVAAKSAEMKIANYVQVLKSYHKGMLSDTLYLSDPSIKQTKK